MELVGLDFLHLAPCGEWYEYLLVISDHFQGLHRHILQLTKRLKQQQKDYTVI